MPGEVLALFANHFSQPLFDLGVIDIVVVYPFLITGIIRRVYVPTDFDTKRKALSRANAAEKGLK